MKPIRFLLVLGMMMFGFLVSCVSGNFGYKPSEEFKDIIYSYDKKTGATNYKHYLSHGFLDIEAFFPFIVKASNRAPEMWLRIQSADMDWPKITKYEFEVDGKHYDIFTNKGDITAYRGSETRSEIFERKANSNIMGLISNISVAQRVIIKHIGKEKYEETLDPDDISAFKVILDTYHKMTAGTNN